MNIPSQTAAGLPSRCPACGIETAAEGACPRCRGEGRGGMETLFMNAAIDQRRRLVKRLAVGLSVVGAIWLIFFGLPLVWAQLNGTEIAVIGVLALVLFGPRLCIKAGSSRWRRRV